VNGDNLLDVNNLLRHHKSLFTYKKLFPFALARRLEKKGFQFRNGAFIGKTENLLHPTPSGIDTISSFIGNVGPDFARSHQPHLPGASDLGEAKTRSSNVFLDRAGNIVRIEGHFNGAPESLTFPVLLRGGGGRTNMMDHSLD
jgi:hypothetical protein